MSLELDSLGFIVEPSEEFSVYASVDPSIVGSNTLRAEILDTSGKVISSSDLTNVSNTFIWYGSLTAPSDSGDYVLRLAIYDSSGNLVEVLDEIGFRVDTIYEREMLRNIDTWVRYRRM